jgi:peptidoglycan hydrolase-like protein with peptidoglycan-binding domain
MADQDRQRLLGMRDAFMASADKHDLPPALLAAIASRETRGGTQLRGDGYSQWDGYGFGVMQVDYRHHQPQGDARSEAHVDQAATILANYRTLIARDFPDWTEARQLQAAVYAYNRGPGAVTSGGSLDALSPGGDYSSDVWARARHLSADFGGTDTDIRVAPEVADRNASQEGGGTEQITDPAAKDEESTKPGATDKDNGRPGGNTTLDLAATITEGGKFKQGDTGKAILEVQRLLGFGPKGQTGELGPYTAQKLREFQQSRGLAADGVVGSATYEALINANKTPDVPIIYQHGMNSGYSDGYCGIATVLQTLRAAGKDPGIDTNNRSELDGFASQMYIPGKGSSGKAMAGVLRGAGEQDANMTYSGTVRELVASLDRGKTVPVGFVSMGGSVTKATQSRTRHGALQNGDRYFYRYGQSGHWASVIAYEGDPARPSHFLVNDPDTGAQLRLTRSELERHTKASEGIWMIPM